MTHRFIKSTSVPERLGQPGEGGSPSKKENKSRSSRNLVDLNSLPDFLNDNQFLLDNHRPELNSAVECIKSAFQLHTETLNIWTHLLGSAGCVLLSIYYLTYIAEDWPHRLAFSIFFLGAIFCMGTSAVYHAFICHSERVCKLLAKMDYCGVIILITTSYVPWLHFAFYCQNHFKLGYIVMVTILGIACISIVVQDKFREPCYRWLRFGLFMALGFMGLIPGTHYLLYDDILLMLWIPLLWLVTMAILYLTGGFLYASCIPERLFPGKFDIWCQSHQILHVCVIGGVLTCFQGASKLASTRLLLNPKCVDMNSSMEFLSALNVFQ